MFKDFYHLHIGCPQGPIMGPIFSNFFDDLFLRIKKSDLHYLTDDSTISPINFLLDIILQLDCQSNKAM